MNRSERPSLTKQVFFTVWAMVTLVLLVCLGMLVYEMVQRGQWPLELVPSKTAAEATPAAPAGETAATEEVLLYFGDGAGRRLEPEIRSVRSSDSTVENCRSALEALIQGPQDRENLRAILPEATRVRALYLLSGGELVVDFSRELIVGYKDLKSVSVEALMLYGVVQTLTQDALRGVEGESVRSVRVLIEGAPPPESFPAHLDASVPIVPDPQWLAVPAA
ncbi:MAG TPA: GerMN domain-containing protein [Candidatus Hydrogenedentes bacterium]|nr:GerMN domain-containing protein [Candidatus Hydrogenedentota bacterium]HPG69948.1 GerMN domain-containing protein [Candidatus Hydrogenedentota bacterium]